MTFGLAFLIIGLFTILVCSADFRRWTVQALRWGFVVLVFSGVAIAMVAAQQH